MFRFLLPPWRPSRRIIPLAAAHVVARLVPAAPCGWVFFDGSETRVETDDGTGLIIPGGAFFPREARRYASAAEAEDQATRLNDSSLCLDRPWSARPASAFTVERVRRPHSAAALS